MTSLINILLWFFIGQVTGLFFFHLLYPSIKYILSSFNDAMKYTTKSDNINEALCAIVKTDCVDITENLLKNHNADIDYIDNMGLSLMQHACASKQKSQVEILMSYGAKINNINVLVLPIDIIKVLNNDKTFLKRNYETILLNAFEEDNHDVIELLIDYMSDEFAERLINSYLFQKIILTKKFVNKYSKILLLKTFTESNLDLLKKLCEFDIDLNIKNENDNTILMLASIYPNEEIIEFLSKQKNININETDNEGRTALIIICQNNGQAPVKLLLNAGADPNIQTKEGWSALMVAIYEGNNDNVYELLSYHSININLQNNKGKTAFMLALKRDNTELVVKLFKRGVNMTLKDNKQRSVYDYCSSDMLILLKKLVKDIKHPIDTDGNIYPILIENKNVLFKAIYIDTGKITPIKTQIKSFSTFQIWNHINKKWEQSEIKLPNDIKLEIIDGKMQYHLHPTIDECYIRFDKIIMPNGDTKLLDDLYI
jgi:ankyrin repeat protein